MADKFNAYQEWLGIASSDVRPNLYELLELAPGESDSERISLAADRALAKVRSVRPGDKAKAWAGLIDELNQAKRCLLDPIRRAEYDAALQRSAALKSRATNRPPAGQTGSEPSIRSVPPTAPATPVDDPRYPPGMAPKTSAPASAGQSRTRQGADVSPAPSSPSGDDSLLPPTTAYVQEDPTGNVAPTAAPVVTTPLPAATVPVQANPYGAGGVAVSAPGWQGNVPATPQPGAGYPMYAQPQGYPAAGYPQQAPYIAQPTYPQPAYVPPAYAPPPAYPPQAYGHPPGYAPPPGAPATPPPPPPSHDPMAPVAMPVSAPMAMPVGYGAAPMAMPVSAGMANVPTGTVPTGMPAGVPVGGVPTGQAVAASPEPAIGVRTSSAASIRASHRRREKGMQTLLVVGGISLALCFLAAAIAYPFIKGSDGEQVASNDVEPLPGSSGTAPQGTGADQAPPPPAPTPVSPTPRPNPGAQTSKPPADPVLRPDERMEEPPPPASSNPNSTSPTPTPPSPASADNNSPPEAAPTPPSSTPPEPTTPTPTPPTPTPPETTTPTPPPTPAPPAPMPSEPAVTQDDLRALSKAMTTARDAMSEHNFEEANAQLKVAEKHAKTPELRAKVERLWQINNMTQQFREAVVAAIQDLEAGEVFKVGGSTQVAVVETFPDKLIVRIAGMNRTYRVADLPAGLAVALADMKLDTADPGNRVIKGAYLLSGKNVDSDVVEKAKTWWDEAQLGGVDVSKLLPVFHDLKQGYDFKKEMTELTKAEQAS